VRSTPSSRRSAVRLKQQEASIPAGLPQPWLKICTPQQAARWAGGTQHGYGESNLTRAADQAADGPMHGQTPPAARAEFRPLIASLQPVPFRAWPRDPRSRPHRSRSQWQGPSLRRFQGLPPLAPRALPVCCPVVRESGPGRAGLLIFIPGLLRERIIFLGTGIGRTPLPIPWWRSLLSRSRRPRTRTFQIYINSPGGSAPRSGHSTTHASKWP